MSKQQKTEKIKSVQSDQIPHGGRGPEVSPLAKELLALDSFPERQGKVIFKGVAPPKLTRLQW